MADLANRYPENVCGNYYVDNQCIDCDLCRETAPSNFRRNDDCGYSYVYKQPESPEQEAQCIDAMDGCPVEAIGAESPPTRREPTATQAASPGHGPIMATDIQIAMRFATTLADTIYKAQVRESPEEALRLVKNYFEVMQEDTPELFRSMVADIAARRNETEHIHRALSILLNA
jgi:ferredoxin